MAEVKVDAVDAAALQQLLPLSDEKGGAEARERMFKEFVVRSNCLVQMGESVATKARSRAWNGTLSLDSLRPLLLKKLLLAKVFSDSSRFFPFPLVEHSFEIAREWLEPVSSTDHECVDLNQWHVMVFALVMEAHVAAAAPWKNDKGGWVLDQDAFADLCGQLASRTRLADFSTPEETLETLSDWAESPEDAVQFLGKACKAESAASASATVSFEAFAKWLVRKQLPHWHTETEELKSRKRAFQLLKLMNNTPSLPNSVPGKLTPRNSDAGGILLLKTLPESQWTSTNRRFFSDSATFFQKTGGFIM
mmetsp:Transcript_19653/g.43403  ORF Transcript_19653/g.43403 Transcript_19653/m.43403 type:complete len:307 (+) Transcript_19653:101-1021(+)